MSNSQFKIQPFAPSNEFESDIERIKIAAYQESRKLAQLRSESAIVMENLKAKQKPQIQVITPQKTLSENMRNHLRIVNNAEYYDMLQQDRFYTEQFQNANRPTYDGTKRDKHNKMLNPRMSFWDSGKIGETIHKVIVDHKRIESKPRKNSKTIVSFIPVYENKNRPIYSNQGMGNNRHLNNSSPRTIAEPLFKLNPESGKQELTKPLGQRLTPNEMEIMVEILTAKGKNKKSAYEGIQWLSPYACERLYNMLTIGQGKDKPQTEKRVKHDIKRTSNIICKVYANQNPIMFYSARTKKNSETICKNVTPLFRYLIENGLCKDKDKKSISVWFNKIKKQVKKSGKATTVQKWNLTIRFEYE